MASGRRSPPRKADSPANGFRGFTISLVVGQPSTVDSLFASAVEAGAETVKPVQKGMWGYGAIVKDADGVIWKLATSAKKDKNPPPPPHARSTTSCC